MADVINLNVENTLQEAALSAKRVPINRLDVRRLYGDGMRTAYRRRVRQG